MQAVAPAPVDAAQRTRALEQQVEAAMAACLAHYEKLGQLRDVVQGTVCPEAVAAAEHAYEAQLQAQAGVAPSASARSGSVGGAAQASRLVPTLSPAVVRRPACMRVCVRQPW